MRVLQKEKSKKKVYSIIGSSHWLFILKVYCNNNTILSLYKITRKHTCKSFENVGVSSHFEEWIVSRIRYLVSSRLLFILSYYSLVWSLTWYKTSFEDCQLLSAFLFLIWPPKASFKPVSRSSIPLWRVTPLSLCYRSIMEWPFLYPEDSPPLAKKKHSLRMDFRTVSQLYEETIQYSPSTLLGSSPCIILAPFFFSRRYLHN